MLQHRHVYAVVFALTALFLLTGRASAASPRAITGGNDPTPGVAVDVAVQGHYAYLANGAEGLQIQDISNREKPVIVGALDTYMTALGVAVNGSYAYVAAYDRLYVVDVTSSPAPKTVAELKAQTDVFGSVRVTGNYAYVLSYPNGLEKLSLIDISTPTAPKVVGTYKISVANSRAYGLAVAGQYVYLAGSWMGLQIVSIADPTAPTLVGSLAKDEKNVPYHFSAVDVSGNSAYVNDPTNGLRIVDVADPAAPKIVGTYADKSGLTFGVAAHGSTVYATQTRSIFGINVSVPTAPTPGTTYSVPAKANALVADDEYLYVADEEGGLQIVNIKQETPQVKKGQPKLLGRYIGGRKVYDFDIAGNYAYLAAGDQMTVLDISDQTKPTVVAMYTPSEAVMNKFKGVRNVTYYTGIDVQDQHAYLAAAGLVEIVNIADPAKPKSVGVYDNGGGANTPMVSGKHLYVSVNRDRSVYYPAFHGIAVFDVADPASPALAGSLEFPYDWLKGKGGPALRWLDGTTLYGVQPGSGLVDLIDVASPAAPKLVSETKLGSAQAGVAGPVDIAVAGDAAYLADLQTGLSVIDVSDEAAPKTVGTFDQLGNDFMQGIAVANDHAYAGQNDGQLLVFDVKNTKKPDLLASYQAASSIERVRIAEKTAYLALGDGFEIVDVSMEKEKTAEETQQVLAVEKKAVETPFRTATDVPYLTKTFFFRKTKQRVFVLIPTDTKTNRIAVLDADGSALSLLNTLAAAKGYTVSSALRANATAGYLALGTKGGGTKVAVYSVHANGARYIGTLSAGTKNRSGDVNVRFLKLYGNQYGLVTMLGKARSTIKVWKYSPAKEGFTWDTLFNVKNVKVRGSVISL